MQAVDNNEVGPPTYTLTTFFMSMFHGMTIEQYLVYVQSLLDDEEQLELADLIVQTTHWHKMRCSGVSVKPFITAIHDSLAPTFEGLPTAVNLRNRYNGYITGSRVRALWEYLVVTLVRPSSFNNVIMFALAICDIARFFSSSFS